MGESEMHEWDTWRKRLQSGPGPSPRLGKTTSPTRELDPSPKSAEASVDGALFPKRHGAVRGDVLQRHEAQSQIGTFTTGGEA